MPVIPPHTLSALLSRLIFCLALLSSFCLTTRSVAAQNKQYTENKPDQSLKSDSHIDPSTLGMSLTVPLGAAPGRAGLNLPISLRYSSKVWRVNYIQSWYSYMNTNTWTGAEFSENSVAGWTSSLDPPRIEFSGESLYDSQGHPISDDPNNTQTNAFYVHRLNVHLPDGSSHELRRDDAPQMVDLTSFQYDWTGNYYAVDGSRLRYDADAGVLYTPDGGRYLFSARQTLQTYAVGDLPRTVDGRWAYTFIDRNGNTLSYNSGSRTWTDTLGRSYGQPLPNNPAVGDQSYSTPGINGPITYTLRWSKLANSFSDPASQPSYTSNTACVQPNQYAARSPYLFTSGAPNIICADDLFNPVVLSAIILPNNQSYQFKYNAWGEIDKVVLPTGGTERYRYAQVSPLSFMGSPYSQGNRGVVERWVSATGDGTDEAHWQYASTGGQVTTTAPDGTRSERVQYTGVVQSVGTYGFEDPLIGMAKEERVYSASGQMLRRRLTGWATTGAAAGGYTLAKRNPRATEQVEILLDTGGSALASRTSYDYDTTYQYDVGVEQSWVRQYDFAAIDQTTGQTGAITSIPAGSLLRQTQTLYLTGNSAYRSRNLLGLPSSVMIYNGYGSLAATTDYVYDEAGYLLSDYASVTGWSDPQTNTRGNVTSIRRWLNTTNTRLDTHTQYDQCGSVRSTTDALNHQTQVSYSSLNAYAYPTQTASATPDSTGHASSSPLTTSSSYDFNTGLLLSTTDENSKTTVLHYTDPQTGATDSLNRLRWVERPSTGCGAGGAASCGRTTYVYGDTPGNLYVETLTTMDATRSLDSFQYFDKLGRPNRMLLNEAGSWLITDTQYDAMGRVWRVSNPYRSTQGNSSPVNPSGNWTTTAYDDLDRVLTVTTPDAAVLTTSYSGNSVTVTDQHDAGTAGHSRKSLTDALGRLTQVTEDPAGLAYQTSYLYDALGNLRMVTQGSQVRYFMYDSLSRLIRAKNPEQSARPALALSDAVTGNSSWSASYDYDQNGNLQTRIDARGVRADYTYDALNRNLTVRYQNDPAGTPGTDRYYDGATLGKGRAWQTITAGSANSYTVNESYDAMGRPLSLRQHFLYNGSWSQNYTVQRSYDLAGHVTSQTYPSGRSVSYSYDAAGRAQSFSGNLGDSVQRSYSSNISYNEWGMQQEQFGTLTPVYNKHFYNVRGQLAEIRESTTANDTSWNRGAIINHYSGHCWGMCSTSPTSATDDNGNVKKQDHWIPRDDAVSAYDVYTDFYEYDSLNRVQSARETLNGSAVNWMQSYVYDRWGNRTIDQAQANTFGVGIPHLQFSVNTATNQLTVPAGQSGVMQYDQSGNLFNDTYTGFGTRTYDAENRMVSAQDSFNGVSSYTLDADGRRVRRTTNNAQVWQVYGMEGELLAEYAANGAPTTSRKEYGYRNGELLISAEASAEIQWLVTDQLGTPRMILDQTGSLGGVKRHDYLPFGEELFAGIGGRAAGQGYAFDDVRQKFTGKERDGETGLDYSKARYYAAGQGRFSSPDPLVTSGKSGIPQSWNRYTYCLNNPLTLVDPTGLEWRTNDQTGELRWYNKDDNRDGTTEYHSEYYEVGGKWVHLNMNGPTHNREDSDFDRRGWDYVDADSVPGSYNGANLPSMQAGPPDNTGPVQLFLEYLTGTGPTDRQFGPNDYMTQNMMTSPDVTTARQNFIEQGGGTYGPTGVQFGLNAEDGPFTAGFNKSRQFVGSFTITISEKRQGDALFVLENTTGLKSGLYHLPGVHDVERATMAPLSNKTQTYFWIERGVIKR